MKSPRTPQELIEFVKNIRIGGRKLNAAGREQFLADCAFKAFQATSAGYARRMPPEGPVEFTIREGRADEFLEAPHG